MSINRSAQSVSFQYGTDTVTIETGVIATQATSSVKVCVGEHVIIVTLVAEKRIANVDYSPPLTVNYFERNSAVGSIPDNYFRRELGPSEVEKLTARLIDRACRPLFPKHFYHEVQIVATVHSCDPNIPTDIPAMLGAAAVLTLSGLPCQGPIAAARIGYIDKNYVLNPTHAQLQSSELDLVIAGSQSAILTVESEANELSIETMLGAMAFGHAQMQTALQAISELAQQVGAPRWDWHAMEQNNTVAVKLRAMIEAPLTQICQITNRSERLAKRNELYNQAASAFLGESAGISSKELELLFSSFENQFVRNRTLLGGPRLDGRDARTIRPITIQTRLLPRAHGSALFTRGETQALCIATLGTNRDAQIVNGLQGKRRESFILHYNFPPYCVGEIGQMGSPKRREIGHANLARRALKAVVPSETDFPYVLRVVSEIMESNGSSSMATVCGASLALMDAGVPLKKPVAGIAMGLIKEEKRFIVLSDILGDEDHLGDMDLKVAGTAEGITALQMDIKTEGITQDIMEASLNQATEGLRHILSHMNTHLQTPRIEVSPYAPRIVSLQISPDKIRDVIGKGGATIRSITEETDTLIDISDNGIIRISSSDAASCQKALERIQQVTETAEVGAIYNGPIVKIIDSGAFVSILPGHTGFLHISEILSNEPFSHISEVLKKDQTVQVKVLDIDRYKNRIRLSMKNITITKDIDSEA